MSGQIIKTLERLSEENRKVLLLPAAVRSAEISTKTLVKLGDMANKYEVLILTDMPDVSAYAERVCLVPAEEMAEIQKLYNTYEFSERFILFQPADRNYGNLFHYVKNGLLTEEECFQVLLGEEHGQSKL